MAVLTYMPPTSIISLITTIDYTAHVLPTHIHAPNNTRSQRGKVIHSNVNLIFKVYYADYIGMSRLSRKSALPLCKL